VNELLDIYKIAANRNTDALVFIMAFHGYAHRIDDVVDGEVHCGPEELIELLMLANALYSTPFYIENSARLSGVVGSIANTYLDSVHWERDSTEWKRRVADVIRLCGNDMVCAVAFIVGGFRHMRDISLRLREFAWHSQHEE
jgi:hypothetical protein